MRVDVADVGRGEPGVPDRGHHRPGTARAIGAALRDAGLTPADIGHVNAHATSTPVGDTAEAAAILSSLGEHVLVSGHQGFFTLEAMREIAQTCFDNLACFLAGIACPNLVPGSVAQAPLASAARAG